MNKCRSTSYTLQQTL